MNAKLLAPAGSFEAMKAAFAAGADECYIGGAKFGARAYADNLDEEQMLQAIDYAHLHNKKLYLTVNTLLKEWELEEQLYHYLKPFYEQGLDAVIVQDVGALSLISEAFPKLAIHASTQMTATGAASAQMLESLGVTRIVTPRELSLSEIAQIRQTTDLEIESFVHGALCYCYSGQCLFSSMLGGRSGNRGRCAQPCRLPYSLYQDQQRLNAKDEQYLLSPKDMCTISILPEIIDAGVTSLKIEGRMKKPEYTAGVVRVYRKYLDMIANAKTGEYRVSAADQQELMDLYNRDGFNQSYFKVHNGRQMMALKNKKKDATGKDITQNRNEALFADIRSQYIDKSDAVAMIGQATLKKGQAASLQISCADCMVNITGATVEQAAKQPLDPQRVSQQLKKTGNTDFYFEQLDLEMEADVFMSMKQINELRRCAMEQLKEQLLQPYRRVTKETDNCSFGKKPRGKVTATTPTFTVLVDNKEQLQAVCETANIERVYCNCSAFDQQNFEADLLSWMDKLSQVGTKLFLSLPYVVRDSFAMSFKDKFARLLDQGLQGFLVHNLEGYALLAQLHLEKAVVLDYQLYTMNERSRQFWQEQGVICDTIPPELNEKELRIRNNQNSEMMIYGYTLMMISAQCLQKNTSRCTKSNQSLWLQDRYLKKFYIKCECDFCYNVIYNSIPFGLLKESQAVKALGCKSLRLSFVMEDYQQTKNMLQLFTQAYQGDEVIDCHEEFTKGHFKRGVE